MLLQDFFWLILTFLVSTRFTSPWTFRTCGTIECLKKWCPGKKECVRCEWPHLSWPLAPAVLWLLVINKKGITKWKIGLLAYKVLEANFPFPLINSEMLVCAIDFTMACNCKFPSVNFHSAFPNLILTDSYLWL